MSFGSDYDWYMGIGNSNTSTKVGTPTLTTSNPTNEFINYSEFGPMQRFAGQGLAASRSDELSSKMLGAMGETGFLDGKSASEVDDIWKKLTEYNSSATDKDQWLKGLDNKDLLGFGLGAGQLGLGLASYLSNSDFMKKQGNLIDQQIANNRMEMDNRQAHLNATNQASLDAAKARYAARNATTNNSGVG